MIFFSPFNRTK